MHLPARTSSRNSQDAIEQVYEPTSMISDVRMTEEKEDVAVLRSQIGIFKRNVDMYI
jgi:hypothetical protein